MPTPLPRSLSAIAGTLALLAGCAPSGSFPSLAVRPIERELASEPQRPAPPEAPSDPQLVSRVAELLGQVRQGEAAFRTALRAAQRATASAGGAGSESWISAQQEISRLEAVRAPTVAALAELDALSVARSNVPTAVADYSALTAAAEEAETLAAAQRAEIDRLSGAVSAP